MVISFQQYAENRDFFSNFPLTDFMIGACYWLFLWNFKKASTVFYGTTITRLRHYFTYNYLKLFDFL